MNKMVRFLSDNGEKIIFRPMPRGIFTMVLILLTLTGCKKNIPNSEKQLILFQYEYINYAWGYNHSGLLIDNSGNVYTYNNPDAWNYPDNNQTISDSDLLENLKQCRLSSIRIPGDELRKYSGYINNIASSKITAQKNMAADAGSHEYFCFQYSEITGLYNSHLIKMEGDFTRENLNFNSKKIVTWIKEIGEKTLKR